jgi:hypothetical protein
MEVGGISETRIDAVVGHPTAMVLVGVQPGHAPECAGNDGTVITASSQLYAFSLRELPHLTDRSPILKHPHAALCAA